MVDASIHKLFIARIAAASNYMTNLESLDELDQILQKKYGYSPQYFDRA